jgi:peptidoglycan/LPS O-acetylase OafA/YrhL
MTSRSTRVAFGLLVTGAAIYLFKFVFILLVGSDATWEKNVEGISFVVATPIQVVGVGIAAWLATHRWPKPMRVPATVGAVIGWFLLIGVGSAITFGGVEVEWPLVLWAALLTAVAAALGRAGRGADPRGHDREARGPARRDVLPDRRATVGGETQPVRPADPPAGR